jgi:hypothetical protein
LHKDEHNVVLGEVNVELGKQHGERILVIDATGPALRTNRDATDLIGDAMGQQATMVVLPVSRLDDAFFDLSTRIAGEFFQKFVNYGVRLAIVGDISDRIAASGSLRDLVYESNRGNRIWLVADTKQLDLRLTRNSQEAGEQDQSGTGSIAR